MALTDDDLQDQAQEREHGAKFVYHVDPIAGLDTQPGKCFRAGSAKQTIDACITDAAANFANKPIGIWFNGPIDKGSGGRIILQTANLGPGVLRGIDRYASISGSIANSQIIWAASNWELSDFRMISTAGVDTYNYLIGDAGSTVTEFVMKRMILEGTTDGPYFTGTGSFYDCYDSELNSKWDTFYNQGNNIVARFWRCFHNSVGPHQQSSAAHVQGAGQSVSGALTQLFDCAVSFRATNSDAQRVAYGLHTQNNGAMELHRTTVICHVPDGGLVDLEADTPSEFRVSGNSSFNLKRSLAGSTGTITIDYSPADVRSWGGDSGLITTDSHHAPNVNAQYVGGKDADIFGTAGQACTLTIRNSDSTVVPGAAVWVTTDQAGRNGVTGVVYSDNISGTVTVRLIPGNTYYLWMDKAGEDPIYGQQFTAVADS